MSDEDFFALFGEDEAQALRLSSVGIVVTGEGRHQGANGDDVFPEIPTGSPAASGARDASREQDRHGDALERFLKICLEPRLRDTRVDVIPRSGAASRASAATPRSMRRAQLARKAAFSSDDHRRRGSPTSHSPSTTAQVLPSHAALLDGAVERAKRLGGSVPPRGAVRREPQRRSNTGVRTIAGAEEIFHGGDANRGKVGLDALDASKRVAKPRLALALEFGRRHAVPLKRRVRFPRELEMSGEASVSSSFFRPVGLDTVRTSQRDGARRCQERRRLVRPVTQS